MHTVVARVNDIPRQDHSSPPEGAYYQMWVEWCSTHIHATTHFTDNNDGLDWTADQQFRYQVMAVSAGGRSQLAEALDGIDSVSAYRSGDGVVVNWQASEAGTVRVDRSADGGETWVTVADGVAAERGSVVNCSAPASGELLYAVVLNRAMVFAAPEVVSNLMPAASHVRATFFGGTGLSGTGTVAEMDRFNRT